MGKLSLFFILKRDTKYGTLLYAVVRMQMENLKG